MVIDEPLAESVPLALEWSEQYCGNCVHYHGAWQLFRHLGVINSMASDDDFILPELQNALAGGARRILVCGAADYALLARIHALSATHQWQPEVTVIDRCETPLKLNQWYAARSGMAVNVVQADALEFDRPGAFDLVCTHSFLPFFSEAQRPTLVAAWWRNLAPGGAVITAQRVRPGRSGTHGYSEEKKLALAERAERLAGEQGENPLLSPARARDMAISYAAGHRTWVVSGTDYLRKLFTDQGFRMDILSAPEPERLQPDLPTVPVEEGDVRWRILARKPGPRSGQGGQ